MSIGKEHVTQTQIDQLNRTIPLKDRQQLLKDLSLALAWMHPIFRALAESTRSGD